MSRNSREDVVGAAGRMFAARGYDGTSMRDLAKVLGLRGSSLYSHIGSKQDLLVEVVRRGAEFFEASAAAAAMDGSGRDQLRALVSGHIEVVLDHRDEVRTFLNEARSLDKGHRTKILEARNQYEAVFRSAVKQGISDGSISGDVDPVLSSIFLLSILNAVDRWYSEAGRLSRYDLADEIIGFSSL